MGWMSSSSVNNHSGTIASHGEWVTLEVVAGGQLGGLGGNFRSLVSWSLKGVRLWRSGRQWNVTGAGVLCSQTARG